MKIDEVIELLTTAMAGWPIGDEEKYYKALELAIEASKYYKLVREGPYRSCIPLLTGETEE